MLFKNRQLCPKGELLYSASISGFTRCLSEITDTVLRKGRYAERERKTEIGLNLPESISGIVSE